MREILTIGRYFKKQFGERVRKIPVSLQGFTCPNIDGSKARGGCIYCKNESFSPSLIKIKHLDSSVTMNFSLKENPLLENQLNQLKEQFYWHANFNKDKFNVGKYIVYFQSFSNTYAPLHTLKRLYDEALGLENVVGLSIGTRIDCVNEDILRLLGEYVKRGAEIWLEYGIQSVFNQTLKKINRAHNIDNASALFKQTRYMGVKVCAHLMYGLPNESNEMMLDTLDTTLSWGG